MWRHRHKNTSDYNNIVETEQHKTFNINSTHGLEHSRANWTCANITTKAGYYNTCRKHMHMHDDWCSITFRRSQQVVNTGASRPSLGDKGTWRTWYKTESCYSRLHGPCKTWTGSSCTCVNHFNCMCKLSLWFSVPQIRFVCTDFQGGFARSMQTAVYYKSDDRGMMSQSRYTTLLYFSSLITYHDDICSRCTTLNTGDSGCMFQIVILNFSINDNGQ